MRERFYSTLVRLKVFTLGARECRVAAVFLFHTGAIKRLSASDASINLFEFLFHTGAIKSQHETSALLKWRESFYSTLVRLKEKKTQPHGTKLTRFLFHTGAIKRTKL